MVAKINLKQFSRKTIIVGVAALVLVGAATYGGYVLYQSAQSSQTVTDSKKLLTDVSAGRLPLNTSETRSKLEASLPGATDKQKYQTYLILASEYQQAKEFRKAAEAYTNAAKVGEPNDDLYFSAALAYEQAGDKANAVTYYKKAKEYVEAHEDAVVRDRAGYLQRLDAKLKELEG